MPPLIVPAIRPMVFDRRPSDGRDSALRWLGLDVGADEGFRPDFIGNATDTLLGTE